MSVKKSLIVDDSKSARAVLKRMLNKLGLEVDTVESAADAISYLEQHRPDVIFMDHMMPEMDGFEAVKRIKDNPKTAVIPIMMYTSKGGDVYLSQARELGAVGIISKTISPVGLKESLFKLGLVDERRIESTLVQDATMVGAVDTQIIAASVLDKKNERDLNLKDLQRLMDDQTIELHKSMWLGIESVSNEIFNKLKVEREQQAEMKQPVSTDKRKLSISFYFVCLLLLASLFFNIKWFTDNKQLDNTIAEVNKKHNAYIEEIKSDERQAELQLSAANEKKQWLGFIVWASNSVIEYSHDEIALSDNQLFDVSEVINKAQEVGYRGKIILQTHIGKFCFSQDDFGELVLADENLPVVACDFIGNDLQAEDAPSVPLSLSFANYLSDAARLHEKGIEIVVENLSAKFEVSAYPTRDEQTKAAVWNAVAGKNNRITFNLVPATDVVY